MTTDPQPTPEIKTGDRYENGYRSSDAFIRRMTTWLIVSLITGPVLGFLTGVLGSVLYDNSAPDWVAVVAIAFVTLGLGIPLLVGAWFGGRAVHRFGGVVGILLFLGIASFVMGEVLGLGLWLWLGVGASILAVILFFYLGFQAKVPIWLQLPILSSPRLYIRRGAQSTPPDTHTPSR